MHRTHLRLVGSLALLAVLTPLVSGCDKGAGKDASKDEDKDKSAEQAKPDAKADPEPQAPEPEPEPEPEIEMVEHDLSSAGDDWAGWSAQGPKGAKIMSDLGKAARIAGGKDVPFDLVFVPKKVDLAEQKDLINKGVEAGAVEKKVTFTTDTEDLLEWTMEGEGWTSYSFIQHTKVGEHDVSCKSLNGTKSEASRERMKKACATLAKK